MGGALSRLARPALARLFGLLDALYRRRHRLEPVGDVFYAGLATWRGARRRLADGTEVAPGDAVLRLHLDGQRVAELGAGGGSAAAVGMRFARRFVPACQALARRLSSDPGWREVVAVHAIGWISPYVGERWGFEFERLPAGPRTWLIRWHMGQLLAVAEPSGRRRGRPRPWPMEMWISRQRLCERFPDPAVAE